MWTPYGDWKFGALSFYMDSAPRLNNLNVISKDLEKRKKIFSQPCGKIILEVETIRKNFEALQISDWFLLIFFLKQLFINVKYRKWSNRSKKLSKISPNPNNSRILKYSTNRGTSSNSAYSLLPFFYPVIQICFVLSTCQFLFVIAK